MLRRAVLAATLGGTWLDRAELATLSTGDMAVGHFLCRVGLAMPCGGLVVAFFILCCLFASSCCRIVSTFSSLGGRRWVMAIFRVLAICRSSRSAWRPWLIVTLFLSSISSLATWWGMGVLI